MDSERDLSRCAECGAEECGTDSRNLAEYLCGTYIVDQGDDEPEVYLSYDCCIATIEKLRAAIAKQQIVMPWDARAIELEPIHGPYCVYAAWREWFEAWNDRQSDNMRLDIDELDKTALFSAFQAACLETRSA